jgi:four helix bundle protein
MAKIEQFEDILAWQKARELTREIYRFSSQGEFAKDFALRDQIRRAVISITSNMAEGFERGGTKEFVQFLGYAKGSSGEVRSQLYVALDESYLKEQEWQNLHNRCLEISRLLDGFIKYLQQTEIKGRKFAAAQPSSKSLRPPAT